MKRKALLLLLLLAWALVPLAMKAETTTVTASRITSSTATWTGSEGESWSVVINGGTLNQGVTNGYAQYGQRNGASTSGTFSTSGISGTITSIVVDCASYSGRGTVSVTVGGSAFGSSQSIPSWSNNAGGTRTFEGSASGNIVVTMTNASNGRAMYIKSITVTYSSPCPTPTNVTVPSNGIGTTSAVVNWSGSASSYNVRYRLASATQPSTTYDFEDGTTQGWTYFDNDNDDESWFVSNQLSSNNEVLSHNGDYYVRSTYNSSAYAENWLISPQISLGGQ